MKTVVQLFTADRVLQTRIAAQLASLSSVRLELSPLAPEAAGLAPAPILLIDEALWPAVAAAEQPDSASGDSHDDAGAQAVSPTGFAARELVSPGVPEPAQESNEALNTSASAWNNALPLGLLNASLDPDLPPAPARILLARSPEAAARAFRHGFRDAVEIRTALSQLPFVVAEQLSLYRRHLTLRRLACESTPTWERGAFSLRHELNNPLAGILGNAELALACPGRTAPEVRLRLERIVQLAIDLRELLQHAPTAA